MYRTPIPSPSKYVVGENSAMGSSACRRLWEPQLQQKNSSISIEMGSQLQPNDAAFFVANFQAREQPQLQRTSATYSMGYPTSEARGGSAYMKQNASLAAGMEPQGQPKEAAISVGSNKEQKKGVSQLNNGTSSGFDEACKEFSRMFREKLQEFAMILSKKYHYNFPSEYFDDYHGGFNKEEFLKMDQPKKKSRWQEGDSVAVIENLEEKIIPQEASSEGLQGNNREAIDEVIVEAKANLLPRVASAGAEGFGTAPDQKFVENGTALDQTNQTKGPAIGVDDVAEAFPQIFDLSKSEEQSHLEQNMDLTWVKIGNEEVKTALARGKPRDIVEEIEGFAEENETIAAVLVFAPTRKSKLLSTVWKDDLLAKIEVAVAPKANAHKQPWYECPRQICNLPLLHFKDADDIFQCAAVVHHGGVGTTAAGIELELYQIAPIEVLGRITMGIDLEYLRTRKKKRPRRTRRERKKNQIEKAGIG